MSRRRVFLVVSCLAVPGLAAAAAPWTLSSDALRATVSNRLKQLYGLELAVAGRSTIAFLPTPRLKFENIVLTAPDGTPVVRGGSLRAELRLARLLTGGLAFSELSLRKAAIDLDIDANLDKPWDAALGSASRHLTREASVGHVERLVLEGVDVRVRDRARRSETIVRNIRLAADWPSPDQPVELSGSMVWRGETIDVGSAKFQPSAVAAGRPSLLTADVSAPLGRLTVSGEFTSGEEPRFAGRAALTSPSVRGFSAWTGWHLPFGNLIQALSLDGDVAATRQSVSWPAARLTIGADRLDGTISARLAGERPIITGTLAADRLDLTTPLRSLLDAYGAAAEPGRDIQVAEARPELDLRLSTANLRVGQMRATDMAANITTTAERYDVAVGHLSVGKGAAKGRMVLARAGEGFDMKAQTSFERLDMSSLLSDLGASRWIAGLGHGQVTAEASGHSLPQILQRLRGRAHVTIRQGELIGPALNDAVRRLDRRSLPMHLDAKGGRTIFDQAHVNLAFADGAAQIVDGALTGAGIRAALQGRVSVRDRRLAIKADVEGGSTSGGLLPHMRLDITGPWQDAAIVADNRPPAAPSPSDAEPPLPGAGDGAAISIH